MKVCLKLSAFFLMFLIPCAYARDTGARPLPDIVHMWDDPAPDWDKPELFPPVEGLVRARIFTPSTLSGGFNHHARIIYSKGKFRAIWSNQRYGEDGPGQRVLYSDSPDARTWSEPRELVPSLAPEAPWGYSGYFCAAYGFVERDGKIYAVAELLEIPLWKNFEQTKTSDVYTPECAWPVYKYLGHLYREILDDGSFGKLFSMSPEKITGKTLFPIDSAANVAPDLKEPAKKYSIKHALSQNPDNRRFCEPAIWRARDGKWVLLLRDDSRSYRKWVAYSDDGKNWTKPRPTDILDAPSLTCALTLDDGSILLIGNHNGKGYRDKKQNRWIDRDPLMVSFSRDGYVFTNTRSIYKGHFDYVVPYKLKNRGGRAQYPNAILKDGKAYVIYSLGKESIEVAEFDAKKMYPQK